MSRNLNKSRNDLNKLLMKLKFQYLLSSSIRYVSHILSCLRKRKNIIKNNDLMKSSAIISSVRLYVRFIRLFMISLRIKWCWISIYFIRAWCAELLIRAMKLWLSFLSVIAISLFMTFIIEVVFWMSSSVISRRSQIAFLTTIVRVIYSIFVKNSATIDCRLKHQLIESSFNMNT